MSGSADSQERRDVWGLGRPRPESRFDRLLAEHQGLLSDEEVAFFQSLALDAGLVLHLLILLELRRHTRLLEDLREDVSRIQHKVPGEAA